jgi:hypothetical protein
VEAEMAKNRVTEL